MVSVSRLVRAIMNKLKLITEMDPQVPSEESEEDSEEILEEESEEDSDPTQPSNSDSELTQPNFWHDDGDSDNYDSDSNHPNQPALPLARPPPLPHAVGINCFQVAELHGVDCVALFNCVKSEHDMLSYAEHNPRGVQYDDI